MYISKLYSFFRFNNYFQPKFTFFQYFRYVYVPYPTNRYSNNPLIHLYLLPPTPPPPPNMFSVLFSLFHTAVFQNKRRRQVFSWSLPLPLLSVFVVPSIFVSFPYFGSSLEVGLSGVGNTLKYSLLNEIVFNVY